MKLRVRALIVLEISALALTCWAQTPDSDRSNRDRADANHPHQIAGISVCSPNGTVNSLSCPDGTFDTQQNVTGANGAGINSNGVHAATDEHSSVFPPGSLQGNSDYLFFLAGGTDVNPDVGVVVLSGGFGPDMNGHWTLNFASSYGSYPAGFGSVFLSPTAQTRCPKVPSQSPADQDQTFDLNYASAGSIVKDPTALPGSLLMIYEGANTCEGNAGGFSTGNGSYITTGVATSSDYGHTWPTYAPTPNFSFVQLPFNNKTQGPAAPLGAVGQGVCQGNDCTVISSSAYGRYAVLTLTVPMSSTIMAQPLADKIGVSEPAGFVDDRNNGPDRYVYAVSNFVPRAEGGPPFADGRPSDLTIARALLNGGTAPLTFNKWDGGAFSAAGLGGQPAQLLPDGAFVNCGDTSTQSRHSGSLSYVEETQQYVLLFICDSQGDPANGSPHAFSLGSAWFYSTSYDLSDPTQWSTPLEVQGSWNKWQFVGCQVYNGWYPTLMSLHHASGHLTTTGYAFYMTGCLGGGNGNAPERQYSSRTFTISTN